MGNRKDFDLFLCIVNNIKNSIIPNSDSVPLSPVKLLCASRTGIYSEGNKVLNNPIVCMWCKTV